MQQTSRRTGYPDGHPGAVLRNYQPTRQWVEHPIEDSVRGRAWTHQLPTTQESAR